MVLFRMNLNNNNDNAPKEDIKNVAQRSFVETKVEEGFLVLTFQNESSGIQRLTRDINREYIQFHFCVKGNGSFSFNSFNNPSTILAF